MSANTPALDPEAFVRCPYEENHRVRNQRLQIHLIQCRKNNPAMARMTARCPFNAKHVVPKVELSFHKMSCPDRAIVDREILHETARDEAKPAAAQYQAPVVNHDLHADDDHGENWELEVAGRSVEPFILHEHQQQQQYQYSSKLTPSRQPHTEPSILNDRDRRGINGEPSILNDITTLSPQQQRPQTGISGVLPSTLKQVGLGRGRISVPVTSDTQLSSSMTPGRQRLATSSSAFGVDTRVGRPPLISSEPTSSDDGSVDDSVDMKEMRKLRKRLKQIVKLEVESANGKQLNTDQMRKVASRGLVERQLNEFRRLA